MYIHICVYLSEGQNFINPAWFPLFFFYIHWQEHISSSNIYSILFNLLIIILLFISVNVPNVFSKCEILHIMYIEVVEVFSLRINLSWYFYIMHEMLVKLREVYIF